MHYTTRCSFPIVLVVVVQGEKLLNFKHNQCNAFNQLIYDYSLKYSLQHAVGIYCYQSNSAARFCVVEHCYKVDFWLKGKGLVIYIFPSSRRAVSDCKPSNSFRTHCWPPVRCKSVSICVTISHTKSRFKSELMSVAVAAMGHKLRSQE